VKGLYWARQDGGPPAGMRRRVLTTSVEHHAILDSVRWLEEAQGAEAIWLAVGDDGVVVPGALRAAIRAGPGQVAVVSVMWANKRGGRESSRWGELAAGWHTEYGVPFHTDAVQAAAQLPVDFAASGADALTVTGHKLGGPVGVGALILARGAAAGAGAARWRPVSVTSAPAPWTTAANPGGSRWRPRRCAREAGRRGPNGWPRSATDLVRQVPGRRA